MLPGLTTVPDLVTSPFDEAVVYRYHSAAAALLYELAPEEAALLSDRAVEKRRREFWLGRAAAHHALTALLGAPAGPVGRAASREPLWPSDVVGSITHTHDVAAAAVARPAACGGLGLDIEDRHRALGLEIARLVCTEPELGWVHEQQAVADLRLRLLFSAKESIFKALYPREQVFLGFEDAELTWDPRDGSFRAVLRKRAAADYRIGAELVVGCRASPDHVQSWLALPPSGAGVTG